MYTDNIVIIGKIFRFSSLYRGSDPSLHFTVTFAATYIEYSSLYREHRYIDKGVARGGPGVPVTPPW